MPELSKLKICYLAGTLGQGGAERQLFYALQALRQNGAGVRVLSFDSGGFWEAPIKELGLDVTCVGEGGSRLKRLLRILKLLKAEPAHIVQSQHFYTNAYAAIAALLCRCKGIGALRSNGEFDLTQCGQIDGRINLHFPRILAANSRSSMQYAINRGIESSRLYFLPNVVDTNRFTPADPDTGALAHDPKDPITLLAAGRLSREKRFDRFISIVHGLRLSGLDVRGCIVGSARSNEDLRPELEQQAAALGLLPGAIQFLGSVADMTPVYRKAHIFVLTSEHEGTPNVLIEAMAAGLPIVATNVGGVPEIVKEGLNGFLLDGPDLQGQIATIGKLIRDPHLRARIGRQARAHVEENYALDRLPAYLTGLYETSFSQGRPGKGYAASISPSVRTIAPRNRFLQHSIKKNEAYEH